MKAGTNVQSAKPPKAGVQIVKYSAYLCGSKTVKSMFVAGLALYFCGELCELPSLFGGISRQTVGFRS